MKIYTAIGREAFELCPPVYQSDFHQITALIDGTERQRNWRPIKVRLNKQDQGRHFRDSDSPWLGSDALIFRRTAADSLRPVLEAHGELLPLACSAADLLIYNPTQVLDALDESASDLHRFSNGEIMMVTRYVFRPEVIGKSQIFKISRLRVSSTFVQQSFVDQWKASGLRGLDFKQVWEGPG
jgi:hypothetical protein